MDRAARSVHASNHGMRTATLLLAAAFALLAVVLLAAPREAAAAPGSEHFNTPGLHKFVVPPGVTSITVEMWGAGGGGAGGTQADGIAGGGGGGGEYVGVTLDVIAGERFNVLVPDGGAGGGPGEDGTDGTDTQFLAEIPGGIEIIANGGSGGLATGDGGAGGTGATGADDLTSHAGGDGGAGGPGEAANRRVGGGGGGGAGAQGGEGQDGFDGTCVGTEVSCAPTGGVGGNPGSGLLAPMGKGGAGGGNSPGANGGSPGGGGGGGSAVGTDEARSGQRGGVGQVRISWDSQVASGAQSSIVANPTQVDADGEDASQIKVTVRTAGGDAIHGALVLLTAAPSAGVTIAPSAGVYTNSVGEATFTAKRNTNGLVSFTAKIQTAGNPDVTLHASVQFGEGEGGPGCDVPPVARGAFLPEPAENGITITTWGGGNVGLLPEAISYWTTHEGELVGYIPGAPDFVNDEFLNIFTPDLPACLGFIVRT